MLWSVGKRERESNLSVAFECLRSCREAYWRFALKSRSGGFVLEILVLERGSGDFCFGEIAFRFVERDELVEFVELNLLLNICLELSGRLITYYS